LHYLSLWKYSQCFLSTPLIRSGYEDECFDKFFAWVDSAGEIGTMLQINYVRGDGLFYEHLSRYLAKRRRPIDQVSYQRALLHSSLDGDEYIRQALSSKSRREFQRQGRRLEDRGELKTTLLQPGDDIDIWIEQLLELEERGWKGRAGTALAAQAHHKAFYFDVMRSAFKRGKLLMEKLTLNDKPIAMRSTFISGRCSYGMKIAYDEKYHKFSPGVQLEFEVIKRTLANPEISWMDSCAEPNHPMFDRLWSEKRLIRHVNIATGTLSSKIVVGGLALARWLYGIYRKVVPKRRKDPTKSHRPS